MHSDEQDLLIFNEKAKIKKKGGKMQKNETKRMNIKKCFKYISWNKTVFQFGFVVLEHEQSI